MVTLGPNLTNDERAKASDLIREFADCFALAVGEVTQVPGAVHWLNIPNDVKFSTKVHQCPLTPPQRQYLNKKIDEMLEAGVIEHIEPSRVKCVLQIVNVRHVPGKINVVADGISRKWEDIPRQVGDGSEWTVCEDWEAATGLVNNILHVTAEGDIHALKD